MPRDPKNDYIRSLGGGSVTAPLVGAACGCLPGHRDAVAARLRGQGSFLRGRGSAPWYIDGFLNQMRQAGMLDEVAGVVVGELEKCDWREERPEFPRPSPSRTCWNATSNPWAFPPSTATRWATASGFVPYL